MKRGWIVILVVGCALVGCNRPSERTPKPVADAIKALGSTVPATQFDRTFWQRQHDANSSAWIEADRLCGQTVLANYPNCLPVNDILETDQKKKAETGHEAALKIEAMSRRGYQYDFIRKEWLPYQQMQAAGCWYADAYPNNPKRIKSFWKCPAGVVIPKGIPDPDFNKEEEDATN